MARGKKKDDGERKTRRRLIPQASRYQWIQIRMGLIFVALSMMLTLVVWRAHQLQVDRGDEMDAKSDRQINREMKLSARRGSIMDRNGVELAVSVEVKSIYANPRFIKDPEGVTEQLREILGDHMNTQVVLDRLSSRRQFAWVARRVPPQLARRVKELKIPGMGFTSESQRFYPLKERAGHLLGFVGGDKYKGLEGLERAFDEELEGGTYTLDVQTDARGRRIYLGTAPSFKGLEGKSVVLSIDERIQYIAEAELAHASRKYGAKSASVVVTDPHTGDILAMASAPNFNPNRRSDYSPEDWRNRATLDAFEPGSTFKSFVVAAAMQDDLVGLEHMIETGGGKMRFGEDVITDHHWAKRMSVRNVIKFSSNVGAYRLAKMLERERFGHYIFQFGFGKKTGIPIAERSGRVRDPAKWPEITLANVAFGHGLTVTNLQMNMALGAIANGGNLMKPRLVRAILDRNGDVVESYDVEQVRQVLDADTVAKTNNALMSVVEEGGTGVNAATAWYKVAGKTGTARKVDPRTKRYSNRLYTASFVGYVPAEKPEIVITVIVNMDLDYRGNQYYGGKVAAPVFARIAQQALPLLGVVPAKGSKAAAKLAKNAPEVRRLKPPAVKAEDRTQTPPRFVNGVRQPVIQTEMSTMPSYINMSVRQALALSREHGHMVHTKGTGRVVAQVPGPGVFVGDGVAVELRFASE